MQTTRILTIALSGFLMAGTALAEKPSWANGQSEKHAHEKQQGPAARMEPGAGKYFDDRQRTAIHDYFDRQSRGKRCPPGLSKKNNGCLPPGQAKKWAIGQPLPGDLIYHALPRSVLDQLGRAPARHRYVRVAADILLIATGTNMVMDAIEDLGRR